jgi:cysteinyl-tRNA synthetase
MREYQIRYLSNRTDLEDHILSLTKARQATVDVIAHAGTAAMRFMTGLRLRRSNTTGTVLTVKATVHVGISQNSNKEVFSFTY